MDVSHPQSSKVGTLNVPILQTEDTKTEALSQQGVVSGFGLTKCVSRIWTVFHYIRFSLEQ